ncbi:MAG: type I phosphomannose isomerase catalytic subunit [Planctomycetia bacterium]
MPLVPLVFEPFLRPQIWGGRRLAEFGKSLPPTGTFGESWEVSAHPLHVSRVAAGPLAGRLLTELVDEHFDSVYGAHPPADRRFPFLLKILDCAERLSIQVHPDDRLATLLLPYECGKTEAWVVLQTYPDAVIYAGLKPGATSDDLRTSLQDGTTEGWMHAFRPRVGDCLLIPAGTLHAVGGTVFVEVQQSSDATFRLFDWNRLGPDGTPRRLHVAESLESIAFDRGPLPLAQPEPLDDLPPGVVGRRLVRCSQFQIDRFRVSRPYPNPYAGRLALFFVLDGAGELHGDGWSRRFETGQSVMVPAATVADLTWTPAARDADPAPNLKADQPTESLRFELMGVTLPNV